MQEHVTQGLIKTCSKSPESAHQRGSEWLGSRFVMSEVRRAQSQDVSETQASWHADTDAHKSANIRNVALSPGEGGSNKSSDFSPQLTVLRIETGRQIQ